MMTIDFADFDLSEIFGKPDLAEVKLRDCLWMDADVRLSDCLQAARKRLSQTKGYAAWQLNKCL